MKISGKSVAERLHEVQTKIREAAERSERDPAAVTLIAVSKTKPVSLIQEAVRAGQTDFGENYVQEAIAKMDQLGLLRWHFIGSLQTNKVRLVVGRFVLIHSVDRLKLARAISTAAQKAGVTQDILLEINVGSETTKGGVSPDEAPELLSEVLNLPNIRVCGLMSLPPLTEDERVARGYFRTMNSLWKELRKGLTAVQRGEFRHLSMGTSNDFEWAVEEGATLVRVGTSIFGEREYP